MHAYVHAAYIQVPKCTDRACTSTLWSTCKPLLVLEHMEYYAERAALAARCEWLVFSMQHDRYLYYEAVNDMSLRVPSILLSDPPFPPNVVHTSDAIYRARARCSVGQRLGPWDRTVALSTQIMHALCSTRRAEHTAYNALS
eukprot:1249688-Pleurochrysis_carterae.AAC.3